MARVIIPNVSEYVESVRRSNQQVGIGRGGPRNKNLGETIGKVLDYADKIASNKLVIGGVDAIRRSKGEWVSPDKYREARDAAIKARAGKTGAVNKGPIPPVPKKPTSSEPVSENALEPVTPTPTPAPAATAAPTPPADPNADLKTKGAKGLREVVKNMAALQSAGTATPAQVQRLKQAGVLLSVLDSGGKPAPTPPAAPAAPLANSQEAMGQPLSQEAEAAVVELNRMANTLTAADLLEAIQVEKDAGNRQVLQNVYNDRFGPPPPRPPGPTQPPPPQLSPGDRAKLETFRHQMTGLSPANRLEVYNGMLRGPQPNTPIGIARRALAKTMVQPAPAVAPPAAATPVLQGNIPPSALPPGSLTFGRDLPVSTVGQSLAGGSPIIEAAAAAVPVQPIAPVEEVIDLTDPAAILLAARTARTPAAQRAVAEAARHVDLPATNIFEALGLVPPSARIKFAQAVNKAFPARKGTQAQALAKQRMENEKEAHKLRLAYLAAKQKGDLDVQRERTITAKAGRKSAKQIEAEAGAAVAKGKAATTRANAANRQATAAIIRARAYRKSVNNKDVQLQIKKAERAAKRADREANKDLDGIKKREQRLKDQERNNQPLPPIEPMKPPPPPPSNELSKAKRARLKKEARDKAVHARRVNDRKKANVRRAAKVKAAQKGLEKTAARKTAAEAARAKARARLKQVQGANPLGEPKPTPAPPVASPRRAGETDREYNARILRGG